MIHHAMVVSLNATKEYMWVDCQFVIFSLEKFDYGGTFQDNHPVPSLYIEHLKHIYQSEAPITSAGIHRWPKDISQASPIHPAHMGLQ